MWGRGGRGGGGGRRAPQQGGLARSITGQLVLHWSSPDTHSHLWLQEAVAYDSGHTAVNRLGWRAKRGEGSRSGLKPSGEPDRGCLPKHAKSGPGGVSRRERLNSYGHEGGDSKRRAALRAQQGTIDVVAIHCSQGSSRSRRFSVPLDPGFCGLESGIVPVHRPSHYKPFTHRFIFSVHSQ